MNADVLLRAGVLAVMGACSVSVWTLRVALTARGRRVAASICAGVEAVVFALVFASVLSSMDSPAEIAGYALGVSAGTLFGIVADGKLSMGQSVVRVIVDGDGHRLAAALGERGWPATRLSGEGLHGAATMLFIVVDDTRSSHLINDLAQLAPGAFWTMERLQTAHPTVLPEGYQQLHTHHRARRLQAVAAAPQRRVETA
jgi:uncharacterized protein YebE (UPF0316 family)